MDLRLETASIRLSSRMLYAMTQGSCQPTELTDADGPSTRSCFLDDDSLKLMDLTTMLSYAAFRLEQLDSSGFFPHGADGEDSLVAARIRSMKHLYRMVLAVSKVHFDRSQSTLYLKAAQAQLRLARKHLEIERRLCACNPSTYTTRLAELTVLDDRLSDMQANTVRVERR